MKEKKIFISFCHCGQIYSVSKPKTYSDHCFDPFPKIETPNRLVGSKAAKTALHCKIQGDDCAIEQKVFLFIYLM